MKQQKLELPATPQYQSDPTFQQGNEQLLNYGSNLASGNIPEWLKPTIDATDSKSALTAAQGILQPQFRDTLQQITNAAAGAGQLESSTFTDALARSQSDLNSQYQSIVSQQAIQSNQNRLGLFGMGLETLKGATAFGKQGQDSENEFNLRNYDNLVAQSIQNNKNANAANGWQQALGMFSPIGHDYLESQGINSLPGYGVAETAQMAAPFFGGGMGGGGFQGLQSNSVPGQYASNSLFSNERLRLPWEK